MEENHKKRSGKRVLLWIGGLASGFLLVALILSPWMSFTIRFADKYGEPASRCFVVNFVGGKLELANVNTWGAPIENPSFISIKRYSGPTTWWFQRVAARTATSRFWFVHIPIWFLLLVVAFLTFLVFLIGRWGRNYPVGHCRECGYNLRGNLSGVCPECGEKANSENRTSQHVFPGFVLQGSCE